MDALVRELELLRMKPQLTNDQVVGMMVAATVRFKEVLEDRMVGIQAIATAVAMQPSIDVTKFHEDFVALLEKHFESPRIPTDLRDIAASIKLAGSDREGRR